MRPVLSLFFVAFKIVNLLMYRLDRQQFVDYTNDLVFFTEASDHCVVLYVRNCIRLFCKRNAI